MIKAVKILLSDKGNLFKFLLLFPVVFLLFVVLYCARISTVKNEIFYITDALISIPFYFYLTGYVCAFINNVFQGKNTLPKIDLKPFKIAFDIVPFLLFIISPLAFIVIDDFVKSNVLFASLIVLNMILFLPMSLLFISFSENFSNSEALKLFKMFDFKATCLCYLKIFAFFTILIIPAVIVINTKLGAAIQGAVLAFTVYLAHIAIFVWFYDLTLFIKDSRSTFNDKIILITGAASGIGQALVLEFNKIGACVIGVDTNSLEDTNAKISNKNKFFEYIMDVSIQDNWSQLHQYLKNKNLIPDILINNAGRTMSEITINDVSIDDFKKVMDINFWGVFYGTKEFLPELLNKKGKRAIINVSSSFGLVACGWSGAYVTSKFAVRGFTETLRQELYGTGILVSCVYPGATKTRIIRNGILADSQTITAGLTELTRKHDAIAKMTPAQAAEIIIKGILKNKKRIVMGYDSKFLDFLSRLLPDKYENIMIKKVLEGKIKNA